MPTDSAANSGNNVPDSRSRSRSLGSSVFPEEDTEEGIFHTEVLLAAQRWFSSQGWPGGPNPITVPNSLRRFVTNDPKMWPERSKRFPNPSTLPEVYYVYPDPSKLLQVLQEKIELKKRMRQEERNKLRRFSILPSIKAAAEAR